MINFYFLIIFVWQTTQAGWENKVSDNLMIIIWRWEEIELNEFSDYCAKKENQKRN